MVLTRRDEFEKWFELVTKNHRPFRFTPNETLAWTPLHKPLAVSVQEGDSNSVLKFARDMLAIRKNHPALRFGDIEFVDAPNSVLAFNRKHASGDATCVFNMSADPVSFGDVALAAYGHTIITG